MGRLSPNREVLLTLLAVVSLARGECHICILVTASGGIGASGALTKYEYYHIYRALNYSKFYKVILVRLIFPLVLRSIPVYRRKKFWMWPKMQIPYRVLRVSHV